MTIFITQSIVIESHLITTKTERTEGGLSIEITKFKGYLKDSNVLEPIK